MIREELVFVGAPDIAGRLRGKAFPRADLKSRLKRGVGWTPTNVQITCFDLIAETPFGALGDVVLVPDPAAEARVDFEDGGPADHLFLGDIRELDGRPWFLCMRSLLRDALDRLKRVAGLDLLVAFEHEFQLRDAARPHGDAYSLAGFRAQASFCESLVAALRAGGLKPDTIMKEYGVDQYEVTVDPAIGLRAADEASLLREIVRSTAARRQDRASFTPLRDPAGVGNGVHIHMSFRDDEGKPATYDPDAEHGMATFTGAFIAGILKYLDSIVALTAPSVVSYTRLTPHRWSAAFNNLGAQDREASVRLSPTFGRDPKTIARQYNFEYRASDAAASPHLALAAIVHAGVQGIEEGLPTPQPTHSDLTLLSPEELAARGLQRLPLTLPEALDRFAANSTVRGWFPEAFAAIYCQHKRGELEFLRGKSMAAVCADYEASY